MNRKRSHAWIDDRSLALARAVAAKLVQQPALFDVALPNMRRWKASLNPWPADLDEWEQILAQGPGAALARLTEDSPRGRRLRQSSPFPGVLTPPERNAIFAHYESLSA